MYFQTFNIPSGYFDFETFDKDITVSILANELLDFTGKWSRIKRINCNDNHEVNKRSKYKYLIIF